MLTFISNPSFCLLRSKSWEVEITNTTFFSHDGYSNLPYEINVGKFYLNIGRKKKKTTTIKLDLFLT